MKKPRKMPKPRNPVALGMLMTRKHQTLRDRRCRRPKDARALREKFAE